MKLIYQSPRSLCFERQNEGVYFAPTPYDVMVDGVVVLYQVTKNVFSLFDLKPDTAYLVQVGEKSLLVRTKSESLCINVRSWGVVGDGVQDDTAAIQFALDKAPNHSTLYFPAGTYRCGALFLKSHKTIYLAKDATLLGMTERSAYPVLPAWQNHPDGTILEASSWEGEAANTHASLITALFVEDVHIIGLGTVDGNAQNGDWWHNHKQMHYGAWRPKLAFLSWSKNVSLHGVTVQNSPSWTIHPYFSEDVDILDVNIENPKDSPNTDGCNPESSRRVRILGVDFSVGDDCIAIKSGKVAIGMKYRRPSEQIEIRNCRMRFGHGGVVLGSEMSGGIRNLAVSKCLFVDTDRGLRVKTRRGRGESAVIDGIVFSNIKMDGVLTPLVVNMFYNCDPLDGKTEYVWSKESLPVDERTPYLGRFVFEDIECTNVEVAAGYFYGLPEQPIATIELKNVTFSYKAQRTPGYPAMMCKIDKLEGAGLHFHHVKEVVIQDVRIDAPNGPDVLFDRVERLTNLADGVDHRDHPFYNGNNG
jgi:polygalacturonase